MSVVLAKKSDQVVIKRRKKGSSRGYSNGVHLDSVFNGVNHWPYENHEKYKQTKLDGILMGRLNRLSGDEERTLSKGLEAITVELHDLEEKVTMAEVQIREWKRRMRLMDTLGVMCMNRCRKLTHQEQVNAFCSDLETLIEKWRLDGPNQRPGA